MAFFGVNKEKIGKILPHPNADRLEIAQLDGVDFQFIIGKGTFKAGDTVLYFPIDSVLPAPLIEKLGLTGKLSGKEKNRIKTVRLRGELSQGIVGPLSLIPEGMELPEEITAYLGVGKYDPPAVVCKNANLLPLPCGLSVYDIEGCERYPWIVESLMDEKVVVSEKVEGSNFSVTHSVLDGKTYVNQRSYTIEQKDGAEHTWWTVAQKSGVIAAAQALAAETNKNVTIYGEVVGPGIQGNYYGLKEHTVFVFDIKIGDDWVSFGDFDNVCRKHNLTTVPILASDLTLREWLRFMSKPDLKAASHGRSTLVDKLREGIVIKPIVERIVPNFGRLIIKKRDPIYLGDSDN